MSTNDSVLAALVTGVSQALLTLFGVDYYAMLWAFVGSLLALTQAAPMSRSRAIIYVFLSTLIGAVLGSGAVAFLDAKHRAFLLVLCLIGGVGSQLIVSALLQVALARIKSFGGGSDAQSSR